jgi:hypothetical protein
MEATGNLIPFRIVCWATRCSSTRCCGQQFGNLPPAVRNTIRAEAGAAEIKDIQVGFTPNAKITQIQKEVWGERTV